MFKSYLISLIYCSTALILGVLALFEESENLDIVLQNFYLVVPKKIVWLILCFLFLFFAGVSLAFQLFRKPMNRYLFLIHYILTILGLMVIHFAVQQEAPQTAYNAMDDSLPESGPVNWLEWVNLASYGLIGAQIVFGINILLSILWYRKKVVQ
jgi:heme/copper-type cytochrome/quinol oxidase subunit 1